MVPVVPGAEPGPELKVECSDIDVTNIVKIVRARASHHE